MEKSKVKIGVSIVIPVYNAVQTLSQCLDSILDQECVFPYEIIVVNNLSTDNSREIAEAYPVIVCDEPKKGASAARNRGVQMARGDIIVFIDSDCYAEKDWLREIVASLKENKNIGACGGNLLPAPPKNLVEEYSAFRKVLSQQRVFENKHCSPPFLLTANLAVRKGILSALDGFDENLKICEDADFCWRLQQKGWQMHYQESARVYHHHRTSLFSFLKQTFSYGYGHTLLFRKYRKQWNCSYVIEFRPWLSIPASIIRLPWTILTGKGKISKIYPLFDIISSASFILGKIYGSFKNRVLVF